MNVLETVLAVGIFTFIALLLYAKATKKKVDEALKEIIGLIKGGKPPIIPDRKVI